MRKELGEGHDTEREQNMHRPRRNQLGVFRQQKGGHCGQRVTREGRNRGEGGQ